jgi:hypothetical protein
MHDHVPVDGLPERIDDAARQPPHCFPSVSLLAAPVSLASRLCFSLSLSFSSGASSASYLPDMRSACQNIPIVSQANAHGPSRRVHPLAIAFPTTVCLRLGVTRMGCRQLAFNS